MSKLQTLQNELIEKQPFSDQVSIEMLDDSLSLTFENLKEFPVSVIVSGKSMKCWIDLAPIAAIREEEVQVLERTMLVANDVTPLSNFSILDGHYCLVGELSSESLFDNIVLELETLVDNAEEALKDLFVPAMK